MPTDTWAERLTSAFGSEDLWNALASDPELSKGVRVEVAAVFDVGVPVGLFTEQIAALDRAFRYATRSAEIQEDVGAIRARGGRPIPIKQGLTLEGIETGSIKFPLVLSERIKAALDSDGLRVIVVLCGLLGGGDVTYRIVDDDAPKTEVPVHIDVPVSGGDLTVEAPPITDIKMTKNGKTVTLRITPAVP